MSQLSNQNRKPTPEIEIVIMQLRQEPLREIYLSEPKEALVVDSARTSSAHVQANQPLASAVQFCDDSPVTVRVGVHTKVGGDSDNPTPGDILCGAIAACLDSTLRIISNRLGIDLNVLEVEVLGTVDVRGTLLVDKSVSVGFRDFEINVTLEPTNIDHESMLDSVLAAAEHSCVVLQTIGSGAAVALTRRPVALAGSAV